MSTELKKYIRKFIDISDENYDKILSYTIGEINMNTVMINAWNRIAVSTRMKLE